MAWGVSPTWKVSKPIEGFLAQAPSETPLLALPFSGEVGRGLGLKFQAPNRGLSCWCPAPTRSPPSVTSVGQEMLLVLRPLSIYKVLGALCQGQGQRPNARTGLFLSLGK